MAMRQPGMSSSRQGEKEILFNLSESCVNIILFQKSLIVVDTTRMDGKYVYRAVPFCSALNLLKFFAEVVEVLAGMFSFLKNAELIFYNFSKYFVKVRRLGLLKRCSSVKHDHHYYHECYLDR